jgi:hypothetical protein
LRREGHSVWADSRSPAGCSRPERGGQISLRATDSATGVDPSHPVRSRASPARAVCGVAIDVGRLRSSARRGAYDSGVFQKSSVLAVACVARRREREAGAAVGEVVVTTGRGNADAFRRQTLRSGDSEQSSHAFCSRPGSASFSSPGRSGIVGGSHASSKWATAAHPDGGFRCGRFPPGTTELILRGPRKNRRSLGLGRVRARLQLRLALWSPFHVPHRMVVVVGKENQPLLWDRSA